MFKRQFSLLVMATLLLSPNLVHANEIDGDTNLSVGNIQIQNTSNGNKIQTPNIQINTPKAAENPVIISRTRRRSRTVIRSIRTSKPLVFNKKVNSDTQTTVTTSTSPLPNSTIRSSTSSSTSPAPGSITRSSTIRNSSSGNDSQAVNQQQQSMQCSGGGSSVSQSTSTVNGRTVSSEVRTNCK
jgi:hypothetical protein